MVLPPSMLVIGPPSLDPVDLLLELPPAPELPPGALPPLDELRLLLELPPAAELPPRLLVTALPPLLVLPPVPLLPVLLLLRQEALAKVKARPTAERTTLRFVFIDSSYGYCREADRFAQEFASTRRFSPDAI